MKRGYTLIEMIIVLAIISILMLPTINIAKSYDEAIRKIKGRSIVNDISNLISYSKYYCRYYDTYGVLEVNKSKGKILLKDTSGKTKTIKELTLTEDFKFISNEKLNINKVGHIQSATIRIMDKKGELYKVSISTGVDTVNIYEGA